MTTAAETTVGGNLAAPAVIAPPAPPTATIDLPDGLSGPGASFLTGQNGKERLAWASYAPAMAGGAGYVTGLSWAPYANRGHRDRGIASAIASEQFLADPTLRAICDTILTNAVGEGLVLTSRVDAALTGMTPEEAKAVSHQIETAWTRYATNPLECDATGRYTVFEIAEQAMLSWLLSGEYLVAHDVARARGATFHTKAMLLDSRMIAADQTKTADGGSIYQGVEFDQRGLFTALHLRRVPLGSTVQSGEVKRVPVFTKWGRKKLSFYFETLFPGMVRGASPLLAALTPVQEKSMLNELSVGAQSLANAFAMVVQSAAPANVALAGLETAPEPTDRNAIAEALITLREAWYSGENGAKIRADASQVVHTAPGDELKFVTSPKTGPDYTAFQKSLTKSAARGAGVSYSDAAGDWSESSFASARLEAALPHRLTLRRRRSVAARLMQDIFESWLEEAVTIGVVTLPPHAKHFWDERSGYTQTKWRGAGQVSSDRKKDADAVTLELSNHLITLEDALAERGLDLETTIAQIAAEKKMLEAAGLTPAYFTSTNARVNTDVADYADEDGADTERTEGNNK